MTDNPIRTIEAALNQLELDNKFAPPAMASLEQVERLVEASWAALDYLSGLEIPYVDRHRPLNAFSDALEPFGVAEAKEVFDA
jgi:hypothetical protein